MDNRPTHDEMIGYLEQFTYNTTGERLAGFTRAMSYAAQHIFDGLEGRVIVRTTGVLAGVVCEVEDVAIAMSSDDTQVEILMRAPVKEHLSKSWDIRDVNYIDRKNENAAMLKLGVDCTLLNADDTPLTS